MKTENIDELIKALRCCNTVSAPEHDCSKCPYRELEEASKGGILPEPDVYIDGVGYWSSCDYEAMGLDASEMLSKLKEGIK